MNDPYIEAARREIEKAAARAPEYHGPCSACKWRRPGVVWDYCVNPVVKTAAFNVSNGYMSKAIQQCIEQRDSQSRYGTVVCGPNGVLFEARQRSVWEIFVARFKGEI